MTFDGIGVNDVIRILRDETFIIRLDAGYIFFFGGGGGVDGGQKYLAIYGGWGRVRNKSWSGGVMIFYIFAYGRFQNSIFIKQKSQLLGGGGGGGYLPDPRPPPPPPHYISVSIL